MLNLLKIFVLLKLSLLMIIDDAFACNQKPQT